jgi:hypothetical protein
MEAVVQDLLARVGVLELELNTMRIAHQNAEENFALLIQRMERIEATPGGFSGGGSVIDTRVLGSPNLFDGQIEDWKDWSFVFCAYVGAIQADMLSLMLDSGVKDMPFPLALHSAQEKQHSAQVYYAGDAMPPTGVREDTFCR